MRCGCVGLCVCARGGGVGLGEGEGKWSAVKIGGVGVSVG